MKHNLRDKKGHFIKKKLPRGVALLRYNAQRYAARRAERAADKDTIISYLREAHMFCTVRNIALSLDLPDEHVRRLCKELRKERKLAYIRRTPLRKARWGIRYA